MKEVGGQVAPPIFFNRAFLGRCCEDPPMVKKRGLPSPSTKFNHQEQQRFNSSSQQVEGDWSSTGWDWDSMKFLAKPSEVEVLQSGSSVVEKNGDDTLQVLNRSTVDEDGEKLTLKLGGSLDSADDSTLKPNKRVRSGSPSGGCFPMCQVDDCRGDLSNAKDYHRRHKVCELHSKTTKALVGKLMQRFCQQCSRFHPLSEFDEGKRSCRRRLLGHNRRRRKTHPEDDSSQLMMPGSRENGDNGNLDVVNLLTILARLQGNNIDRSANSPQIPQIPDKDGLVQIISKINNSLPVTANSASWSPSESFDLNVPQQAPSDHSNKIDGNTSSTSTTDLLTVLSGALATSSPDKLGIVSQRKSHGSDDDKTKLNCFAQDASVTSQKESTSGFPLVGERSKIDLRSPIEFSDCQIQESRPSLMFQLFSSSPEGDTSPNLGSAGKYFSADSSNPMEERSPLSPAVVQKLFPLKTRTEIMKHERTSISGEDNGTVEASTSGRSSALELFKRPNGRVENGSVENHPYQADYTSSSGSDQSPSSSNSDAKDRTGRIIFKLFDKDPSVFPGTLRTQIFNWLSHSPSEMESYIRPGCVILSVYVSMPATAWDQLQEDIIQKVNSLVQDPDSDFWRSGRFLVHIDGQLVSHKDGKVRLCKSWKTWSTPELVSVSPLAVVGGKETSLVLKGRNLTVPGTKIHCTYLGGYMSKEISGLSYEGMFRDGSSLGSFKFPGGTSGVLGRCFVEVENGFKGNCFPVIIADDNICQELKVLESEFEEVTRMAFVSEDRLQGFRQLRSREEILHFLNELGWVFQGRNTPLRSEDVDSSYMRFKYLFAVSVDRDWCALVKALLDILVEKNSGKDGPSRECMEALSEIHLLNRAVKRKCGNMVELLVHYSLTSCNAPKKYLFPPNLAGPGGFTPLHLAASMKDSEDLIDALTNDPQEIGLRCWVSLQDANGQSPYAYASMRNNHSYNRLVAQKLADRKHGQVTIVVGDAMSLNQSWVRAEQPEGQGIWSLQRQQSCTRCAALETRYKKRLVGAQGLLQQPYVHSLLSVAAVCVCVCLLFRCLPDVGSVEPFKWENLHYGSS